MQIRIQVPDEFRPELAQLAGNTDLSVPELARTCLLGVLVGVLVPFDEVPALVEPHVPEFELHPMTADQRREAAR